VIYIAAPYSIFENGKKTVVYTACPEYGIYENDISAIMGFMNIHCGAAWVSDHTQTEIRNSFYASGYILKFARTE
jgi:hypothetical protein